MNGVWFVCFSLHKIKKHYWVQNWSKRKEIKHKGLKNPLLKKWFLLTTKCSLKPLADGRWWTCTIRPGFQHTKCPHAFCGTPNSKLGSIRMCIWMQPSVCWGILNQFLPHSVLWCPWTIVNHKDLQLSSTIKSDADVKSTCWCWVTVR